MNPKDTAALQAAETAAMDKVCRKAREEEDYFVNHFMHMPPDALRRVADTPALRALIRRAALRVLDARGAVSRAYVRSGIEPVEMQTTGPLRPDSNPKSAHGIKKTPYHLVPVPAIEAEAWVFGLGAQKYGAYNWRDTSVAASVYYSAALRHLTAWLEGEDRDPESGQSHLAHARACLGILLDAQTAEKLIDDRPGAHRAAHASGDSNQDGGSE